MPDITENERRILEYLRTRRAVPAPQIPNDLKIEYQDVEEGLRTLGSLGLVKLNVERTSSIDLYYADISGKGIMYLQGRKINETIEQVNALAITGSTINAPIIQGTQGSVNIEMEQAFSSLLKEIDSHKELPQHEMEILYDLVNKMKAALDNKERGKFQGLKSSLLKFAPFLASVVNSPQFQELVHRLLGG